MTTEIQCSSVCADLAPAPVLLNMVAGGITPDLSVDEANNMGYKIIIFPGTALATVFENVGKAMKELKENKRVVISEARRSGGVKYAFNQLGMKKCMEFDIAAGGGSFVKGA